jgi:hypothetical protein
MIQQQEKTFSTGHPERSDGSCMLMGQNISPLRMSGFNNIEQALLNQCRSK